MNYHFIAKPGMDRIVNFDESVLGKNKTPPAIHFRNPPKVLQRMDVLRSDFFDVEPTRRFNRVDMVIGPDDIFYREAE